MKDDTIASYLQQVNPTFIKLPQASRHLFVQRNYLRRLFSCTVQLTRLRLSQKDGIDRYAVTSFHHNTSKVKRRDSDKLGKGLSRSPKVNTYDSSTSSDSEDLFTSVLVTRRNGKIIECQKMPTALPEK